MRIYHFIRENFDRIFKKKEIELQKIISLNKNQFFNPYEIKEEEGEGEVTSK